MFIVPSDQATLMEYTLNKEKSTRSRVSIKIIITRFLQKKYDKHMYIEESYNTIARFSSLCAFNRNFLNDSPLHGFSSARKTSPTLRLRVTRPALERALFSFSAYCTASNETSWEINEVQLVNKACIKHKVQPICHLFSTNGDLIPRQGVNRTQAFFVLCPKSNSWFLNYRFELGTKR